MTVLPLLFASFSYCAYSAARLSFLLFLLLEAALGHMDVYELKSHVEVGKSHRVQHTYHLFFSVCVCVCLCERLLHVFRAGDLTVRHNDVVAIIALRRPHSRVVRALGYRCEVVTTPT